MSTSGSPARTLSGEGELLMATIQQKSYHAKPGEVERNWYIVDAEGQTVGRLASRIAHVLRGKHKPQFTASIDTGDFVVVINAEKVVFKGAKLEDLLPHHDPSRFNDQSRGQDPSRNQPAPRVGRSRLGHAP
jgi:ribosomal protein L13